MKNLDKSEFEGSSSRRSNVYKYTLYKLNFIAEKLKVSKAEAIREAIRFFAEELKGLEVVELRNISKEEAKKEVMEFIKGKDRVWADEIAEALRLDLSLVNDVLMELWSEGYVEPD